MKKFIQKAVNFSTQSPTKFFFVAAIMAFLILLILDTCVDEFKLHDVIVESHGVFFDLLVFGILLSVYESLREKRDKIDRLHEEIDDYRGWDEIEAMYRIVGAIKRLNKLKISKIDLHLCYLQYAKLGDVKLQEASLPFTKLLGAFLMNTDLTGANLLKADLREAFLVNTNLTGADLTAADLTEADLTAANITEAILYGANLHGANLWDTNLELAIVTPDWFQKLETWQVIGREAIIEKYYIDENNRLQLKEPLQA